MRRVDIIADPGQRSVQDYNTAGGTANVIDTLILLLQSMCLNQGWSTVASTTTSGHPDRTMQCVQVPWYDDEVTPPASYKGKMRVRFYATANNQIKFRVHNSDGTVLQSAGDSILTLGAMWTLHVVPYQMIVRSKALTNGPLFIASALQTPRWFQLSNLVECIYSAGNNGSNGLRHSLYDDSAHQFIYIESGLGVRKFDSVSGGTNTVRIQSIRGYAGGTPRIANPIDNPLLDNASVWFPFMSPPAVAYPNGPSSTTVNDAMGTPYYGFIWDMIYVSALATEIEIFANGATCKRITFDNSAGSSAVGALYLRES